MSEKIIETEHEKVACKGVNDETKHPINYINLESGEVKSCMYCGQKYVKIVK